MKYKAQFKIAWKGTWIFEATDDVSAWETAFDYIEEHTQVIAVGIESIYEINNTGSTIRKLPEQEACEKAVRKDPKEAEKQDKAVYKAYFSDGECSGPYVAKISENDVIALGKAEFKLKQHVEYNKLDVAKIKVTQVEELNENMLFTINVLEETKEKKRKNKKGKKKNRFLL